MKLKEYVEEFNFNDEEIYVNDIDNEHAYEWLDEEIPLLECPDADIEKTYYFRWWVYRKHLKKTPEGYVITEFLPKVGWSGRYNTINASAGHHIMEGRWLKNSAAYINDYINFFLNSGEDAYRYSTWLIYAAEQFNHITNSLDVEGFLKKAKLYYEHWENTHMTESGLFWSYDDRDAMEFSISGTKKFKSTRGIRPTLNSYMYGDAMAIYRLSRKNGINDETFLNKAEKIKKLMIDNLWREGFFKAVHPKNEDFSEWQRRKTDDVPRELIGYIPWYFSLPDKGERVFNLLDDNRVFYTGYGLTTADKSDERFLFEADHECLWNGYIWPFATSQTLTALANVIFDYKKEEYAPLFVQLLHQYAGQHKRIREDGKSVMWIDETMHPLTGDWSSRTILKNSGWMPEQGGYERGKDYNHSTYCDLVISGLGGVRVDENGIRIHPIIPDEWDYFLIDKLHISSDTYRIQYDKYGTRYNGERGLRIYKNNVQLDGRFCPVV